MFFPPLSNMNVIYCNGICCQYLCPRDLLEMSLWCKIWPLNGHEPSHYSNVELISLFSPFSGNTKRGQHYLAASHRRSIWAKLFDDSRADTSSWVLVISCKDYLFSYMQSPILIFSQIERKLNSNIMTDWVEEVEPAMGQIKNIFMLLPWASFCFFLRFALNWIHQTLLNGQSCHK